MTARVAKGSAQALLLPVVCAPTCGDTARLGGKPGSSPESLTASQIFRPGRGDGKFAPVCSQRSPDVFNMNARAQRAKFGGTTPPPPKLLLLLMPDDACRVVGGGGVTRTKHARNAATSQPLYQQQQTKCAPTTKTSTLKIIAAPLVACLDSQQSR